MIDSIDNSTAAPSVDADFSGAVSPEGEVLSEASMKPEPPPALLGEDGGFVPDWYARFDELKGMEKSLSKFKTPEALAKSYAELERLRHYPGVENEEQMARFRRMAGLPESEEEYRLERPESMPESEWNAGLAERMARTAYRYGVPPEAMNALQETMSQAYEEAREQMMDSRMEMETQAEQSLQHEWGANYERNMGRATAALQRLASETGVDADALLDNPGLGSNPDVIRLLYQASRLLDEAPLHHSGAAEPSPEGEAIRMESDPSHPLYEAYMNVNHPNHKYANELYDRLISR
ncbi:hypothetical protein [Akkermansia sp.]|uniref:hypothetical protein n=1 Tax=Akkermansia sp. TaxID=1872421 RepID=UPI0025C2EDBF|nr:hypothetical protein [Akkermansia sp.]MCC8148906.1 hypothetical protein [Akkermansia sp.]